jgi:TetR/AcrR family transcriptional regulator
MMRGRHAGAWKHVVLAPDEQFDLKRTALLRQAARAFSAKGYHHTSLIDVGKTLGVTKSALYYYVKSKEEILFECHLLSHELGDQAMAFARTHGKTGREKVALLARRYLELLTGEMGSCAVLTEFHALSFQHRTLIRRRRDAFERDFRALISEGIVDGSIRQVDPKLTVFFFMGAVNWLNRWFRPDGERSGNEIAAQFAELLDHAVRNDKD